MRRRWRSLSLSRVSVSMAGGTHRLPAGLAGVKAPPPPGPRERSTSAASRAPAGAPATTTRAQWRPPGPGSRRRAPAGSSRRPSSARARVWTRAATWAPAPRPSERRPTRSVRSKPRARRDPPQPAWSSPKVPPRPSRELRPVARGPTVTSPRSRSLPFRDARARRPGPRPRGSSRPTPRLRATSGPTEPPARADPATRPTRWRAGS
jgi:hypothetical protein